MSDKTCGKCQHWHERNVDVGVCLLNPRVWAGSWEYPAQFALDTCSHHSPALQLTPKEKPKEKRGEKL